MLSRWRERYGRARESFWFLPTMLVVIALLLSQVALFADRRLELDWAEHSQLALGVDGSRGLLTTIGGSVLAVAATAFSITISVIATASSSYGPRLVRNFMADRGNQFVLGVFVSTFAYCIVVLRSVTSEDSDAGREAFVPYLSVYLAILVAMLNIACLVYFIHHIADSIQISTLIESVRNDLRDVAAREFPEDLADLPHTPAPATGLDPDDPAVIEVRPDGPGFVTALDVAGLLAVARHRDLIVEIVPLIGDHVIAAEPIARVRAPDAGRVPDGAVHEVRKTVTIDDARTPHQDIRFGVQQLVEMAVRALSTGSNDPYTAENAIDELGAGLAAITRGQERPDGIADEDGELRVILRRPRAVELIDLVFDDLRTHGTDDMRVVRPTIRLAKRISEAGSPELAQRAWMHIDLLLDAYADSGAPEFDVERMRDLVASSTHALRRRPWPPEPTR